MTSGQGPDLLEKDFINEGIGKNPFPFWLWLFLLAAMVAIFWGVWHWYSGKMNMIVRDSPFLQVTNRQMSLFLWQNPEFMRINAKDKNGYLPAFYATGKVTIDVANADQFVAAPPELLFRYHTWKRLLSDEFTERPIPSEEFKQFLSDAEEWHPMYWVSAGEPYARMVKELPTMQTEDLATLSKEELPTPVRMAFQGWLNYFKEGDAINALEVTEKEIKGFLEGHPHYARNFWRNIVEETTPNYLMSINNPSADAKVPKSEITPFLRVALFNYLKSRGAPE